MLTERLVPLPLQFLPASPRAAFQLADCKVLEETRPSSKSDEQHLRKLNRKILKRKLHPSVKQLLKHTLGFTQLTPIQLAACAVLSPESSGFDPLLPTSSDVVLSAPTGQGKTLAYVLPIISSLFYEPRPPLRAIILVPTRELAAQIYRVLVQCCAESHLTPLMLSGAIASQVDTEQLSQNLAVSKYHIVVATPGRFFEYAGMVQTSSATSVLLQAQGIAQDATASYDLWKYIRWIVLDEADRLLEQNWETWIQYVNQLARHAFQRPRKVLVSATMTENPEKLEVLELQRPLFFVSSEAEGSYTIPSELKQFSVIVPSLNRTMTPSVARILTVTYLLHELYAPIQILSKKKRQRTNTEDSERNGSRRLKTVIFCNSRDSTSLVASFLKAHFQSPTCKYPHVLPFASSAVAMPRDEVSGASSETLRCNALLQLQIECFTANLSQKERSRLLYRFEDPTSKGPIDVLVCSDILARGMDINNLDVVINYEPPASCRSYIHRAGRTARAGNEGYCFTLLEKDELPLFQRVLKTNVLPSADNSTTLWDLVRSHTISKAVLKQWAIDSQNSAEPQLDLYFQQMLQFWKLM